MAGMTAGIDWASEADEVCVSEEGRVNERFSATHDERGIAALAGKLVRLGVCRVAIERPDGILVERLLAAGLEVLAIHPNQVKAARARFAVAHGTLDSLAEAEDVVQESWLRLQRADPGGIQDLRAWLTTVVARLSLDALKAAHRKLRHVRLLER